MTDSKKLWLSIDKKMKPGSISLGRYTSQAYIQDPIRLSFITARYKFCARMLKGFDHVMEIGCGDGFGSGIVAQSVKNLICTDINEELLEENKARMQFIENIDFKYHDFRKSPYPKTLDAIYLIDTIEHIFPSEEGIFMENIARSLKAQGACLIGTPNIMADQYANNWSREGHVNLKGEQELMELSKHYFHNAFFFGMNDEIVHTGFPPMAHFIWSLCVSPKGSSQ